MRCPDAVALLLAQRLLETKERLKEIVFSLLALQTMYTDREGFYKEADAQVQVLKSDDFSHVRKQLAHTASCYCIEFDPLGRWRLSAKSSC